MYHRPIRSTFFNMKLPLPTRWYWAISAVFISACILPGCIARHGGDTQRETRQDDSNKARHGGDAQRVTRQDDSNKSPVASDLPGGGANYGVYQPIINIEVRIFHTHFRII